MPTRTTARIAAFIPGASPPLVRTAKRFIVEASSPSIHWSASAESAADHM
jgi:hypothetical protein